MDTPVIGLKDLMVQHEERIRNGMKAYELLEQLRAGSTDQAVRDQFNSMKKDLGYGLLLKRYTRTSLMRLKLRFSRRRKILFHALRRCILPSVSWWHAASCCWRSLRSPSGV